LIDLPSWMLIFPVLGILIFIHELGHFMTAKWFGVRVKEFGFGFPPRIFGVKYKDTIYSINLIPLGGFVKLLGEEDPDGPDSFAKQAGWKRVTILVAGPVMNLILPVIIFSILFMLPHDKLVHSEVVVNSVAPNSPAEQSGLKYGDTIIAINDEQIDTPSDLVKSIGGNEGSTIRLTVRRSNLIAGFDNTPEFAVTEMIELVPRANPPQLKVVVTVSDPRTEISLEEAVKYNPELKIGDTLTQGAIGVTIGIANPIIRKESESFYKSIPLSFKMIQSIFVSTKDGLSQSIRKRSDPGFAGPIGIAQMTGQVVDEFGFASVFQIAGLLSVSLGILNLLPIPALDGGRLLFVLIEIARGGKKLPPGLEGKTHLIGFALLLALILVISYRDVLKILSGDSILN
jgi:regulator of sigma E protease